MECFPCVVFNCFDSNFCWVGISDEENSTEPSTKRLVGQRIFYPDEGLALTYWWTYVSSTKKPVDQSIDQTRVQVGHTSELVLGLFDLRADARGSKFLNALCTTLPSRFKIRLYYFASLQPG